MNAYTAKCDNAEINLRRRLGKKCQQQSVGGFSAEPLQKKNDSQPTSKAHVWDSYRRKTTGLFRACRTVLLRRANFHNRERDGHFTTCVRTIKKRITQGFEGKRGCQIVGFLGAKVTELRPWPRPTHQTKIKPPQNPRRVHGCAFDSLTPRRSYTPCRTSHSFYQHSR